MKSKKGAVILLISSLGFLLTVILLSNFQVEIGMQGKRQADLLEMTYKGETALLYVDQMAKLSLAEAWSSKSRMQEYVISERCTTINTFNACKPDFERAFEFSFIRHLNNFNEIYDQDFKFEDFNIEITPYGDNHLIGLDVVGNCDKKVVLSGKDIIYSVLPNFHLERVSVEELDNLK